MKVDAIVKDALIAADIRNIEDVGMIKAAPQRSHNRQRCYCRTGRADCRPKSLSPTLQRSSAADAVYKGYKPGEGVAVVQIGYMIRVG